MSAPPQTRAGGPPFGDGDPRWERRFRRTARVASVAVAGLGAVVLVGGWLLEIPFLRSVVPGLETMKANTAALFVLLGVALWGENRGASRAAARWIGLVVVAVASLTLTEYVARVDLGIDQLLARDAWSATYPGRMAPSTAADFLLLGLALCLGHGGWRERASEAAALLAGTSAFVALCGYLYGVRSLYAIGAYASIALHTTIGILVACGAFLLGRPDRGIAGLIASDTDAGRLLRRLLPATVLAPMIIGCLRLRGELAGYYDMPFGVALMTMSTALLLGLFTSVVAASLRRSERRRRAARRELIDAGERFRGQLREVVESSPQAIAMFDRAMRYVDASRRWLGDYGLTGDVIGKSHYDLFPELPEHWKAVHRRCLAGAVEESDGERFQRADGTVQWVRWKVCPWRDVRGVIAGILMYAEDITAARRADVERERLITEIRDLNANLERAVADRTRDLALAKETLDRVIAIAGDAIVTVDQEQRITIFNHAAERIFGWRRDEVLGRPVDVLVPERFRDGHRRLMAAFASAPGQVRKKGGRPAVFGVRKNGEEFPAEAAISRLEVGGQALSTVILRDVTEERRFAARQAVLVRVGEILESAPSIAEVARQIADAVLPLLGDVCGVLIVEDGAVRAHVTRAVPALMPTAESLRAYEVSRESLTWQVYERREAVMLDATSAEHWGQVATDADHRRLLESLALRAGLWLPLLAHGRCYGAVSFHTRDANRSYARDLDVAEEVARRLGLALESALLRERSQLEAALTLHLGEGILLIRSSDGAIMYANPQFERMFGYAPRELVGKPVSVVNSPRTVPPEQRAEEIMTELRKNGTWRGEVENVRKDGTSFWCYASVASFEHPRFGPVWISVHTDVTERKRLEEERARRYDERETLLKEIHHGVKNNLQVIASLLYLQRERTVPEPLRRVLDESRDRIQAIALVHEKLYRAEDLARIDFGDYLRSLASTVTGAIGVAGAPVRVEVRADPVELDVDRAIPCALIMNELVSNALKHAFPGGRGGAVRVVVARAEPGAVILEVGDDGIGFPPELDFAKTSTLGMQLVVSLTKQLRGAVELVRGRGTTFRVRFPVPAGGADRPGIAARGGDVTASSSAPGT